MRPSKISCITDERVISEAVSQSPMSSAKKIVKRQLCVGYLQILARTRSSLLLEIL